MTALEMVVVALLSVAAPVFGGFIGYKHPTLILTRRKR